MTDNLCDELMWQWLLRMIVMSSVIGVISVLSCWWLVGGQAGAVGCCEVRGGGQSYR